MMIITREQYPIKCEKHKQKPSCVERESTKERKEKRKPVRPAAPVRRTVKRGASAIGEALLYTLLATWN